MPLLRRLVLILAAIAAFVPPILIGGVVAAIYFTPLQGLVHVTGDSMTPVITRGAAVFVWETTGPFESGDVVMFHTQPGCDAKYDITSHIFLEYEDDGTLKTQGAAVDSPDNCTIRNEDVIGKVYDVGLRRWWFNRTPMICAFLAWLAIAIVMVYMWPSRIPSNSPSSPV